MVLSARAATIMLIMTATLLRLGWSAALEASTDESYNWLYTVHPALSYFDHPPMTMWVAYAGQSLCGGHIHPFSLRLGFVLLCAGSTWILFLWTARYFGEAAGFWAAAALTLSHYYTAFGGCFALPDSPLLFFSLLTWWQASLALEDRGGPTRSNWRLRAWLLTGVGFGGAMLSKYHAILLPAGVFVFVVLTPKARRVLATPGPYLAVLVGALLFSPVIIWNAQNDWASFRFQGGRMTAGEVPILHGGPLVWLLGPILYLLPWIWFWLMLVLVRGLRRYSTSTNQERLLLCLSMVPLLFFLATSCMSGAVLPHWPLIGFVPLFPLVGACWAKLRTEMPRVFRMMAAWWVGSEIVILVVIFIQVNWGLVPIPAGVHDITGAYSGWTSVAEELDRSGLLNEPNVFLFTNQWDHSGQLAYALRNRRPVACYHSFDARGFAVWSRPEDYLGRTGLLVIVDEPSEAKTRHEYEPFFQKMTLAAEFPMTRGGRPFRTVRVYRCKNQIRTYPFAYTRAR